MPKISHAVLQHVAVNCDWIKARIVQVHVSYLQLLPTYSGIISQTRSGLSPSQATTQRCHKLRNFQCIVTEYLLNFTVVPIRIRELRSSQVGPETDFPGLYFCGHFQAI